MHDEIILKAAKKRVGFKKHLTIYLLINLFLWILFFFLFKGKENGTFFNFILFIFLTWTILIVGHYYYAIKWNKKMLEKEVQNLIKETEEI
jgi:hypothetical protein